MKKTLLLTIALLLSTAMFAQNRDLLLKETFDSTEMPEGWTINGLGTTNWSISNSNKAGGDANELRLNYYPSFTGISRIVTTPVDLTGIESVIVSFKHYFDNFLDTHTIGIATSSDGTTWNIGWSQAYNSTGGGIVSELISTPDMGKENVLFCIYYDGYSYNINDWYFDDIEIFTQENLDLKLVSIDVPNVVNYGMTEVSFTVQNMGATTVESFTIETKVIDGYTQTTETETFETNLAPFETAQFTMGVTFNLDPGTYNLPIDIIGVNGTQDDDTSNNLLIKVFNAAMGNTQRIPMIEHFSSSTCPPCVNVNFAMASLTEANPGKYTYTKYPCYWPGTGDPYCNDDTRIRVSFYACNAAPQTFLDGIDQGFTSITQAALDEHYATPAFANVRGAFNVEGNTINVIADFMSYFNMSGMNAYISINEKTTTGNVGSNGETEFHHILMKMLEDGYGNPLELNAGEYKRFEYSFDMSSTFVEEMDDLEVSLWIQDTVSGEIFNSHFAYEYTDHCYPVEDLLAIVDGDAPPTLYLSWNKPENGTPVGYDVYVDGELMADNLNDTYYSNEDEDICYNAKTAEVVAVYEDGKTSVGVAMIIVRDTNVEETTCGNISVYPNPARDYVKVSTDNSQQSAVRVYNTLGMMIEEIEVNANEVEINTSNYNTGVYFINIETENGNVTKKFIKN